MSNLYLRLHTNVLLIVKGWLDFENIVIGQSYYIKTNIMFHTLDLNEYENQIRDAVRTIDSILNSVKLDSHSTETEDFILSENTINEDGLIIKANENGGWGAV